MLMGAGIMPLMGDKSNKPVRIKITFDVEDTVRRALGIVAARDNVSVGELIADMVTRLHPDAIKQAADAIATGDPTAKRRPPRAKP